jgi:hypothetical protein
MYYLILLIFWFLFFFPLFQGKPLFDDTIEEFYPMFYFLTENLKNGNFPIFNPYLFSTLPFIHGVHIFELNPIFILRNFIGIFNNSLYVFNILVSLSYLLSLIFFYLYVKNKLKFQSEIAVISALIYTFSSCYILTVIHPHTYDFIPLIPLILYFLDKPHISALFMGFAFTVHPQKPFYLLIIIFFIYFFKFLEDRKYFLKFIIFLIVFMPFVISYYFQGIDLFNISKRVESDLKFLLEMSFHLDRIITFIIPNFYGSIMNDNYSAGPYYFYTEMTFYFSLIGIIFSIIGALSSYKNKFVLSLIISSIILFFLALGDQNPILKVLYESGVIKGLRAPARALFLMPVIVAILSCYGINYVLKSKNLRLLNYIVLFIILVFLFFFFFKTQTENGEEVFKFLIILTLLYVLSYGFVKGILKENLFLYSLAILVFLDIYINFNSYLKIERYSDVESYYKPYFVEYLKANNLGEYRVNARFYKGIILPRNSGNINKIELTEGYDPLVSKYYVEFYDHIVKRKEGFENLLKMANVKYYITDSGFVELKDYLPRAYLVYCAQVIKDSSTFFSNVKNLEVHECVYLNDEPKKTYNLNEFYKPVKILKYTTNEILIEYESDKDAILVLSNSYYPYWKAKLDNREVKILRANWTFMAIEVPKGKHLVKFHYDYKKFVLFLSFWLFGIALSIVFSYFKI